MSDHVISVGPVVREGLATAAGTLAPAYAYRCSCGAHGPEHVAIGTGGKARNEALELARVDGVQHHREANRQ